MGIESNNDEGGARAEDPLPGLPPLEEAEGIIDRAVEVRSGETQPRSVRQRLGELASRRHAAHYDAGAATRQNIVEQAVVAQMRVDLGRSVVRRNVRGPRAA